MTAAQPNRRKHILIVDGDPEVRNLWKATLGKAVDLVFTESGSEARIALEERTTPDLILLSSSLSDEKGFNFLKRLRLQGVNSMPYRPIKIVKGLTDALVRKYFKEQLDEYNGRLKQVPVIVVTDIENKEEILLFKKLNIAGYIKKPIDAKAALTLIATLLARQNRPGG